MPNNDQNSAQKVEKLIFGNFKFIFSKKQKKYFEILLKCTLCEIFVKKSWKLRPVAIWTDTYIHRKLPPIYTETTTQERDHKNEDGLKLGYHHASRGENLK